MQIRAQDSRPLFRQISDTLREQIRNGTLCSGAAIPSEREYAEKLQISRMTVRAAINELVQEGLLVRRPGSATTVAASVIDKTTEGFLSFTEDMQMRGMRATSQLLDCHEEVADAAVAAQLGLRGGARIVVLERVRLADDEPMALERVQLPAQRFPNIQQHDFAQQSLYSIMEKYYGCTPRTSDETIEAVSLSHVEAAVLDVPAGSPALLARRITRDADGVVIEAVKTIYRGDHYRMVFARRRN
ncbi:MAG: GntR family transcriptional regulator [Chloroflexi bacterium]|nr:GntR family transcriptional regulator [Chloroflexota bacterium]